MASSTGSLFLVIWGTLLLSRSMRAKDNQHATQLLYMYNIFTDNVAILGHTIRSMNVSSQVDCFRHCAKVCGCVAFQLTGWKCELLDADKDVVGGDLVTRLKICSFEFGDMQRYSVFCDYRLNSIS